MCGIAGIVSLNGQSKPQARALCNMVTCMLKRGPDDEGYLLIDKENYIACAGKDTPVLDPASEIIPGYPERNITKSIDKTTQVALGHRRLKIVDLSMHGHQPLCTADKRFWIVYNGEIYNYQEIRKEIKEQGLKFHGNSDTEVLINAYRLWGTDSLVKLNGMFAFAIWDNKEKTLFCARDRIGIKPFYYTIQNGQLIFASDIKTIIASGLYTPKPDMEGVYLSMAFGIAPRPKTAFKDIVALEQAHWMRVSFNGQLYKERYWSIPVCTQNHAMSESQAVEYLEEYLTNAIERQLIADVPVGTFMSGGIDSTTISSIASELHPGIMAFTLAYERSVPEMDELPQAIATANMHPMQHVIKRVNSIETLVDLNEWVDGYEEPYYNLAANHVISKFVSDNNISVVLNGLGGDELFAGYASYRYIKIWQKLGKILPFLAKAIYPVNNKFRHRIETLTVDSADRLHTALFSRFSDVEIKELFHQHEDIININTIEYVRNMYVGDVEFEDPLEAMSYMDIVNYIGNHHVHRSDQFTMMHSVEGRFPFLDHELVELAFRIPSKYKIKNGIQKYVLKKVAEKYIPRECFSMKKKGFGLPLTQWMQNQLKPLVQNKIECLKKRKFVNPLIIDNWYTEYLKGKRRPDNIWHIVALEMWYERFIVK